MVCSGPKPLLGRARVEARPLTAVFVGGQQHLQTWGAEQATRKEHYKCRIKIKAAFFVWQQVRNTRAGVRRFEFQSQLCSSLAVNSQAMHINSLSLSFPIFKWEVRMLIPAWWSQSSTEILSVKYIGNYAAGCLLHHRCKTVPLLLVYYSPEQYIYLENSSDFFFNSSNFYSVCFLPFPSIEGKSSYLLNRRHAWQRDGQLFLNSIKNLTILLGWYLMLMK